jgi:hypothetical protein
MVGIAARNRTITSSVLAMLPPLLPVRLLSLWCVYLACPPSCEYLAEVSVRL